MVPSLRKSPVSSSRTLVFLAAFALGCGDGDGGTTSPPPPQTTTARFFSLYASRGSLGAGNAYDVEMPDLSAAIGWDTQFAIRSGIATNWWVGGGGVLDLFDGRYLFNSTRSKWAGVMTGITAPADGAVYLFARTVGTSTP